MPVQRVNDANRPEATRRLFSAGKYITAGINSKIRQYFSGLH